MDVIIFWQSCCISNSVSWGSVKNMVYCFFESQLSTLWWGVHTKAGYERRIKDNLGRLMVCGTSQQYILLKHKVLKDMPSFTLSPFCKH